MRLRAFVRTTLLALLLGVVAIVIPDSTPAPVQFTIVKLDKSDGVDVDPDVIWVLGVGSDARPRENPLRVRGDALQLVGINTRTGAATAIGIPRDSWVPIPGAGSNRVNAALFFGGPELLGRTVGNLFGIQPDYVVVATFSGLAELVKGIGGIAVNNPRAFSDASLHPRGWPQGKVRLNGMKAVEFARVRKSLPHGDFDRSANQQRVIRGIHRQVVERAAEPGFIEGQVINVLRHLHTKGLSPAELFRVAQAIAQVDPAKVTGCVLPGRGASINGASVVLPDTRTARRWGDDARRDAVIRRC